MVEDYQQPKGPARTDYDIHAPIDSFPKIPVDPRSEHIDLLTLEIFEVVVRPDQSPKYPAVHVPRAKPAVMVLGYNPSIPSAIAELARSTISIDATVLAAEQTISANPAVIGPEAPVFNSAPDIDDLNYMFR